MAEIEWRIAYRDHGPYSPLMTKEDAIKTFKKEGGAYIVKITAPTEIITRHTLEA